MQFTIAMNLAPWNTSSAVCNLLGGSGNQWGVCMYGMYAASDVPLSSPPPQVTKGSIVGYFSSEESDEFQAFRRTASTLADECGFFISMRWGLLLTQDQTTDTSVHTDLLCSGE